MVLSRKKVSVGRLRIPSYRESAGGLERPQALDTSLFKGAETLRSI